MQIPASAPHTHFAPPNAPQCEGLLGGHPACCPSAPCRKAEGRPVAGASGEDILVGAGETSHDPQQRPPNPRPEPKALKAERGLQEKGKP